MHLGRKTAVVVAVVGALSTGALPTAAQDAPVSAPTVVEQLFVQSADSGRLASAGNADGEYMLTLRGVPAEVTSFSERPDRVASVVPIDELLDAWDSGPFSADPPNAALVIADAHVARDTFVFALAKPRYDPKRDTLRYRATLVRDEPTGRLAGFALDVDANPPATFLRASLFIDALPVQSLSILVSEIPPGGQGNLGFIESAVPNTPTAYVYVDGDFVRQGSLRSFTSGPAGFTVYASPNQSGTTAVEMQMRFCVPEGAQYVNVDVSGGSAGVTYELIWPGYTPKTITSSQSVEIPTVFQQAGCIPAP